MGLLSLIPFSLPHSATITTSSPPIHFLSSPRQERQDRQEKNHSILFSSYDPTIHTTHAQIDEHLRSDPAKQVARNEYKGYLLDVPSKRTQKKTNGANENEKKKKKNHTRRNEYYNTISMPVSKSEGLLLSNTSCPTVHSPLSALKTFVREKEHN
jgi:hypothetical protein